MGIFADYSIGLGGPPKRVAERPPVADNDHLMTKRRRPVVAPAVVLIAAMLWAACADAPTIPTGRPSPRVALPMSPTALPTFTAAQFKQLLSTLKGKPVVVNIWASWCGPCNAEAPGLAAEARRFQGQAQFLGVDIADQRAPATAFIRKYGWSYPSVFDPTGAIRDDLGFVGQPITVLYDASGKQSSSWSGPVPEEALREELEDLVGG
jgi:cytochrome c biogenesis protein CcmG, thiol:disulfide interchange protein DsbE